MCERVREREKGRDRERETETDVSKQARKQPSIGKLILYID